MKKTIIVSCLALTVLLNACNDDAKKNDASKETTKTETSKDDMTKVRSDIQAIENQWADAQNKKDVNALMALYADDAVSMPDGEPTVSGKAAIKAKQEKDLGVPAKYASIAFETLDVYGQRDVVTEVGKTMYKDAAGKTIGGGKYIAVYEKRDGKWLCIREIYNKDSK